VIALFDTAVAAETAARRVDGWAGSTPLVRLDALGVLAKDENGSLSLRKLGPRETRKGAGIGLLAGALAASRADGLTVLQGLAVGAAGGSVVGSLFRKDLRVSHATRSRIAIRLSSGGAAVLAVVPARHAAAVTEKLVEYGGTPVDAGMRPTRSRHALPGHMRSAG
jgi:uncharacterized membrane protein